MSSFNVQPASEKNETTDGVIYVQVAPWTKNINLKLVLDKPTAIDAAAVPVMTSDASMAIRYNPANLLTLDGEPIFVVQAMPGMRSGVQLGPDVTGNLRRELQEMKSLGVNVIANTAGDWWLPEIATPTHVDPIAAQYKWYYDVLIREEKMKLMGWSRLPARHGQPILRSHLQGAGPARQSRARRHALRAAGPPHRPRRPHRARGHRRLGPLPIQALGRPVVSHGR